MSVGRHLFTVNVNDLIKVMKNDKSEHCYVFINLFIRVDILFSSIRLEQN